MRPPFDSPSLQESGAPRDVHLPLYGSYAINIARENRWRRVRSGLVRGLRSNAPASHRKSASHGMS